MTEVNKTTTVKKIKMAIAGMKDDGEVWKVGRKAQGFSCDSIGAFIDPGGNRICQDENQL